MRTPLKITAVILAIAIASDIGFASAIESAENSEDCAKPPVKVFTKVLNFSRKKSVTPFSKAIVKKVAKKVRKKVPCLDDTPPVKVPVAPPSAPAGSPPVVSDVPAKPVAATEIAPGIYQPLPTTVALPSQGFPIYTGYEPPRRIDPFFGYGLGWGFGGFGAGPMISPTTIIDRTVFVQTPAAPPINSQQPIAVVSAPSPAYLLIAGVAVLWLFRKIRGEN